MAAALLIATPAARADLAPGTWAFDDLVWDVAAGNGAVFAAGEFTGAQRRTGGGIIVPVTASTAVDPDSFPRVEGSVNDVLPDGAGGFFIAGDFTRVGALRRTAVAHLLPNKTVDAGWDAALPAGAVVNELASAAGALYLGGKFDAVGGHEHHALARVAASTAAVDSTWTPPLSTGQAVSSLAVANGKVYVGGTLGAIAGSSRSGLAAFDAGSGALTAWNPAVTSSSSEPYVAALEAVGDSVYVAGRFNAVGSQPRKGIAAVDATSGAVSTWSPAPPAELYGSSDVGALAVFGSTLYVGGGGCVDAYDLTTKAKTAWRGCVGGQRVTDLAVTASTVFVAGSSERGIRAMDRGTGDLTPFDPRPSGLVHAVAVSNDDVYVGGQFEGAGPLYGPQGVARILPDGTLDTDWASPCESTVLEAAVLSGTVYVSNCTSSVDGQLRGGLAALDEVTAVRRAWYPDGVSGGSSQDSLVATATAVYFAQGSDLYAFDPVSAERLPGWNPQSDGRIDSIAADGGRLYVGGDFTQIGGAARSHVAALNPTTGSALTWNPGADRAVESLLATPAGVYAAGSFARIGGRDRYGLALLDTITGAAAPFDAHIEGAPNRWFWSHIAQAGSSVYLAAPWGNPTSGVSGFDQQTGAPTASFPSSSGLFGLATLNGSLFIGGYVPGYFTRWDPTHTPQPEPELEQPGPETGPVTPPAAPDGGQAPPTAPVAPRAEPPAPQTVTAPPQTPTTPPKPAAKPRPAELRAGKLALAGFPVRKTKKSCPTSVTVTVTSAKLKTIKKVKVKKRNGQCELTATIVLKGKLAKAKRITVAVSGTGVKKSKTVVTAT